MKNWLQYLKSGLGLHFVDTLTVQVLERNLLSADCGIEFTAKVIAAWQKILEKEKVHDAHATRAALKEVMSRILYHPPAPFKPGECITLWGVNGVGKTTTAAKLAYYLQQQGHSVLLGACDTFRAAATEQLDIWAQHIGASIVKQMAMADSASVAYDSFQAQRSRGIDFSILDTAGRMHHNLSLQQQSQKIVRVLQKIDPEAPQHRILVLDAHLGQNSIVQAQHFHEAIDITGIIITKWDGGAKAGFLAHIADTLQLPVYFIASGETIESLELFDLDKYIDKLLG